MITLLLYFMLPQSITKWLFNVFGCPYLYVSSKLDRAHRFNASQHWKRAQGKSIGSFALIYQQGYYRVDGRHPQMGVRTFAKKKRKDRSDHPSLFIFNLTHHLFRQLQ